MSGGVEDTCRASKIIWREKLFNRQEIHRSLHPGHCCYCKNEMLCRLPYYYIKFFFFVLFLLIPWTVIFSFFLFIITIHNFHSLFLQGFLMRTYFFTAVFPAINHWFEEAVVEIGDAFSIIYIFTTRFVKNLYSKVQ